MTYVSAPGKIVLWGEYAVLTGAAAGVMALSNRASIRMEPSADKRWHFESKGFFCEPASCPSDELPNSPQSTFLRLILAHWGYRSLAECSTPLHITTDSSPFFAANQKLGLGSSAAVCTATYRALCALTRRSPALSEVMALHRDWQGGKGSGLDVASAWHGGLIHFQQGLGTPADWPEDLYWQVVWSGKSAKTTDHITHFDQWRNQADNTPLNHLGALSNEICEKGPNLPLLTEYCQTLRALDEAAILNIFTQEHARLGKLAAVSGALYKPCGAGGGDIGIAFSDDPHGIAAFRQQAAASGFLPLDLEMATNGVAFQQRQ